MVVSGGTICEEVSLGRGVRKFLIRGYSKLIQVLRYSVEVFRGLFPGVLLGVTTENTDSTEFHGKNTEYRRFAAYGIHGKNLCIN